MGGIKGSDMAASAAGMKDKGVKRVSGKKDTQHKSRQANGRGTAAKPPAKCLNPLALFALLPLAAAISAGPDGGTVVGGSGSISHHDQTTTIRQDTSRMAIDWQSYNVGADERVQYIQPDSSSISLNRVLSNNTATQYNPGV